MDTPFADLGILDSIRYQEGNLWEFYFVDTPKIAVPTDFNSALKLGSSLIDLSYFKYLVQDATFGLDRAIEYTYDEATRKQYPTTVGGYSTVTINFKETEEFSAYKFLKKLHARTYNSSKEAFNTGDPTIMGILTFYEKYKKPKNSINSVSDFASIIGSIPARIKEDILGKRSYESGQVFILYGMRLETIGDLSVAYTNTEPMTIASTFVVNKVEPFGLDTLLGAEASSTLSSISSLI